MAFKELDYKSFDKIKNKIVSWDYSIVFGECVFIKYSGDKFAHIELTISKSNFTISKDSITWKVEPYEINQSCRNYVVPVLSHFNQYVKTVKKNSINLHFEITDGTYSPKERPISFHMATVFAVLNCFDKNIVFKDKNQNQNNLERIKARAKEEYEKMGRDVKK